MRAPRNSSQFTPNIPGFESVRCAILCGALTGAIIGTIGFITFWIVIPVVTWMAVGAAATEASIQYLALPFIVMFLIGTIVGAGVMGLFAALARLGAFSRSPKDNDDG